MEDNYLDILKKIICRCKYTNTYKMAWIKAIITIINKENKNIISLKDISKEILKDYWNISIVLKLNQCNDKNVTPLIEKAVKELYEILNKNDENITFYNCIIETNYKDKINECTEKISKILLKDVAWRFLNFENNRYELYEFDKDNRNIQILEENTKTIKENYNELISLIEYRWTLILDTFNNNENKVIKISEYSDISIEYKQKIEYYFQNKLKDKIHKDVVVIKLGNKWQSIKI